MRSLGFIGALALFALASVCALLAADVHGWQRTLRSDDGLLPTQPRAARWQPPTKVGSAAEHLLGLGDDVAFRRALARFVENVNRTPRLDNAQDIAVARGQAEQALGAVARANGDARASQAETLLGVLIFTDIGPSQDPFEQTTGIDPNQAQSSLADFTDAVRTDPDNEIAKYDLELALRLLLAKGVRTGAGNQTGGTGQGRHGAGSGVSGGGY